MVRRRALGLVPVLLALLPAIAGAYPSEQITTDPHHVLVELERDYARVELRDGRVLARPGEPEVPVRVLSFVIPPEMRVTGLRAQASGEMVVSRDIIVGPRQEEARIGGETPDPVAPDRTVYEGEASFPPGLGAVLGQGFLGGYRIATVAVHPLRWSPATGELLLARQIDVELVLEPADDRPIERGRITESAARLYRDTVASIVVNSDDVGGSRGGTQIATVGGPDGFAPRYTPSLEGTPVEYVIITNDELAPHFEPFADAKTARGIPTVVKTLTWIDANYPGGCDQAERIRFFLQDAYTSWGTSYVLIGGDTGVVPVRIAYTQYYGGNEIPCELYYADLDGTWNDDGDERFGEAYGGETAPGDSVDLYCDVFVGRAPVSNEVEVENFIAKCEAYASGSLQYFTNRSLYLAEVLFPYDWDGGAYSLDGATDIVEPGLPFVDAGIHNVRLYANDEGVPGSYELNASAAIDSLDLGYNVVVHVGHGNKDVMRVGLDNYIGLSDVSALSGGVDRCGFWWLLNCTSTAIDYDCIAERAIRNPVGGASGLIGPTRYAFPSTGREYLWDWLNLLYAGGVQESGPLYASMRAIHASFAESGRDNTDRWTQLSLALLGDPEQRIWTARPRTLNVSFPGAMQVGESGMTVTVTDPSPVEGARVCAASPDGGVYASGVTDASGVCDLWLTPVSTGILTLTVSAPDHFTFEEIVNVTIASGAHVHAVGGAVDDDDIGASAGNGNGLVEAGEIVELDLTIANVGILTAADLTVDATISDPFVTLEQATATPGDLEAGEEITIPAALRFTVAEDCPNEWDVDLALLFTDATRVSWADTIPIRVFAPVPLIDGTLLDDSLYGDGDGNAEWGETIELDVTILNDGNGSLEGLTGILRYEGTAAVITDSLDSWGTIPGGATASGSGGFTVSLPGHVHDDLTLDLTDAYGMSWTLPMDIDRPEPPDTLWGRVKGTTILLYWAPSVSPDTRGYAIWRGEDEAGPFEVVSDAAIENAAYYTDVGLEENTRYYYRVTTVDSSGLASLGGGTLSLSTNPPSQPGWPLTTGGGMYSSVAVVDVDGDGTREVFVASDEIYAWNADGSEVLDGDGDPRSDGIFATDGTGGYRCSPAIGEVDGDPGLEIVAAAWTNVGTDLNPVYEVFVWNAEDGSVAPGWPVATRRFCWASPALADLDNDGRAEVVIPSADGKLYCWRYDGSELLDGDDDPLTTGVFADLGSPYIYASPAIADIDGDGDLEILQPAATESVYCFNPDGTQAEGWPVYIELKAYSSPAVGDVDGDGDLEVAITSKAWKTWIFDHEGEPLPGWPKSPAVSGDFPPSPVFADVTGNGALELIQVSSEGQIWIWNYDGSTLSGWPQQLGGNSKSSPAVADVDGDPDLEIIVGCDDGKLYAFDSDGALLDGWPILTDAEIYGSPTVCDLDGDGDTEVVVGGMDTNVYAYDCAGSYDGGEGVEWGTFLHDAWRTQFYGFSEPVAVPGDPGDDPAVPASGLALEQNRPNPFNPTTEIGFFIPDGAVGGVQLTVYGVDGSLVRRLVNATREPGPGVAVWDGLDDRGRRVASGVYVYRLTAGGETLTRKMVLLK